MGGLLGGGGDAGGGSGGGGGGGGSAGGSFSQQPEQSQFFSNWSCEQVMTPKSSHSLHVLPLQSLAHESGSDGGLGGSGELGGGRGHSHASTWAGGSVLCVVAAGTAGGADGLALSFVRVDGWLRSGMEGGRRSDAHHPGMKLKWQTARAAARHSCKFAET